MARIRFSGRVLPTSHKINIGPIPALSCLFPDFGFRVDFEVKIADSVVTVDCECPHFDLDTHLVPITIRALDLARAPVDLLAFARGFGFQVIFETFADPDGKTGPLVPIDESMAALATSVNKLDDQELSRLLDIMMLEPPFYRIFRDLNRGLTETHGAPRDAFRAVEGIRHLLSPGEQDKLKSWRNLSEILRIDRSFIDPIRQNSTGARHGESTHVPGRVQADVMARAWQVMNRYIEFRMRGGSDPLPISDFPILT